MRVTAICLLAAGFAGATPQKEKPASVPVAAGATLEQKRIEACKAIAADYSKRSRVLDDPVTTRYVQHLAEKLAMTARLTPAVKVTVSQQPTLAAFPGGFLFVSTTLLRTAQSESELAAVIAHQLGHVVALRKSWPEGSTDAARPVIMFGPSGNCQRFPDALPYPAGRREQLRPLEDEADRLALDYLTAAGYDLNALPAIFERLNQQTRSMDEAQMAALRDSARKATAPVTVVSTSEFQAIQARLALLAGTQKKAPTLIR